MIVDVKEFWHERTSSESLTDGITGRRYYMLQSNDPEELEGAVYAACPVVLGDNFPGVLTCICHDRSATRTKDSRLVWYITCSYKSILSKSEKERIMFAVPTDRAARIVWASRTILLAQGQMQQAVTTAGKRAYQTFASANVSFPDPAVSSPVSNTAGDMFDPTIQTPVTEWIVSVTKNVPAIPETILTYNNAVNNAEIVVDGITIPKGCAKSQDLKIGEDMQENGTNYRQLSLNLILRSYRPKRAGEDVNDLPEPWDIEVLNEGMRTFDGTKWKNILDRNNQAVSKPVPLDADGRVISPNGAPIPSGNLYWCLFRNADRKDFSVLPLA